MRMNNSDLLYNEPIRSSSSTTFVSSPTKSIKNSAVNPKHSDRSHLVVGSVYQNRAKGLSKTGPKVVSGNDSNDSFPPPPQHIDLYSPDRNYDYSSSEANSEYSQQILDQRVLPVSTQSPKNMSRPSNKNQVHAYKKNSIHKHSQKSSRRDENKIIDRPVKIPVNEDREDKDWMPMRQLFNAHKL